MSGPYTRRVELACQHVSWFRRGLLRRGQIACFAGVVTLIVVGTIALHLGYATPDWVVMLLGSIVLATWLGMWFLALPLGNRKRGTTASRSICVTATT